MNNDILNKVNNIEKELLDIKESLKFKEPKLRPYKCAEEFIEAQKKHGLYFTSNRYGTNYLTADCVWDNKVHTYAGCIPYECLAAHYIWEDKTPCGIRE